MAASTAGVKILSFETSGDPWPCLPDRQARTGPERECINPDCHLHTRAESGICTVCIVEQRADERVARGEVEDITTRSLCSSCKDPFVKLTRTGTLCPKCQVISLRRYGYSHEHMEREKEKIMRRTYVIS